MDIHIRRVRKTFRSADGEVTALRDISLTVPANRVTTLLGPSRCGKTTLLRCIAGLETPDSGEIAFGERVVWSGNGAVRTSVPPDQRGVGMVFQTYAIWPHMTVFENVAYPLEARRLPRDEIRRRVMEALAFVQLQGFERRPATALSGGQQQRVALARALVSQPKIILFDEPLSNLDAKLREETRRDLRRLLTQLGLTALYVTHDRHEALALSDLVVVMKDGAIVEAGSPKDIYFRPKTRFVVEFLGGTNFLEGTVMAHETPWTRVRTPLGELLCEGRPDMVPGQRATVYIRTDAIRTELKGVVPDPGPTAEAAAAKRFRGRIRSLIFLGEHYDAEVAAGPQDSTLTVRIAAGLDVQEGQEIDLSIDPAGCRLLE